ncbi:MAG TPA: glycosyltransferase [Candidatus Dormibacteraeota bacterium]|nr:glycosyltransferase [Candidatus Dormibacteraeota bacterium]
MRAVHQLLPVYSVGDAIGGAVLRTRGWLRDAGFASDVFAERWDHRLEARPARDLLGLLGAGDALMYHLSIGSPAAAVFEACAGVRVIVYHNITPARYYEGTSQEVAYWIDRGRADLRRLVPQADLVVGVSRFNLEECLPLGPRRTAVVPPPVDLERLRPRTAVPSRPPRILAVGRIAPNKRHDTLVRALAALRATALPDAVLVVAGGSYDTGVHLGRLRDLAARLGVSDAVEMPGTPIPDERLGAEYARASVLASASEHEGFFVPALEAMALEVPVVAAAEGAVPETVGGAGLLVDGRDPLVWAATLARAISDTRLRAELVSRGRRRLAEMAGERVRATLLATLAESGVVP